MRIAAALLGAVMAQNTAWSRTVASDRPSAEHWPLRSGERLLTTPPVILQFGWTASDVGGLMDELSASATPQFIVAEAPGVLEYICSPRSIIPWGAPLFRIYELDLLSDLRQAEMAAARIGDLPVVVAPRQFPSPTLPPAAFALSRSAILEAVGARPVPGPVRVPSGPLVRLPQSGPDTPRQAPRSPPAPPAAAPVPSGESLSAASDRLAAAEERVKKIASLVQAVAAEVRAAGHAVAPLEEDVAARRRLANAGVIARNDVKAAEERLSEAKATVEASRARMAEAESALHAAEAERDAALAGLKAARKVNVEPPSVSASPHPPPRPPAALPATPAVPADSPGERVEGLSDVPVPDFPSPTLTEQAPLLDEVPPPEHSFRLAPRRDVPGSTEWGPLPLPAEAGDLARPRWREQIVPYQCVVSRALLPQGTRVVEGVPVLEVRETAVGRVRAEIDEEYVGLCRVGVPVKVVFPNSGAAFLGWISRVAPTRSPRPPGALVEILLVKGGITEAGIYGDLEWMSLSSPMLPRSPDPLTYRPPEPVRSSPTELAALFPLGPAGTLEAVAPPAPPDGKLSGSLQLVSSTRPQRFHDSDPVAARKLRKLREWRKSFIEGMKTTVFPDTGLALTYPREREISRAVERLATRRVSHQPNMCAKTLSEAFGWGLGDAAMWARRLPDRGYLRRPDGIARPGDIVVWPFSYGPSRSQHIGIAVAQGGTMMLLSNEGGVLGTTPLKGGYLAFHKPKPGHAFSEAAASSKAAPTPAPQL